MGDVVLVLPRDARSWYPDAAESEAKLFAELFCAHATEVLGEPVTFQLDESADEMGAYVRSSSAAVGGRLMALLNNDWVYEGLHREVVARRSPFRHVRRALQRRRLAEQELAEAESELCDDLGCMAAADLRELARNSGDLGPWLDELALLEPSDRRERLRLESRLLTELEREYDDG